MTFKITTLLMIPVVMAGFAFSALALGAARVPRISSAAPYPPPVSSHGGAWSSPPRPTGPYNVRV